MEFVRARDALDKALAIDPNYVKAYAKKGDCHFYLKEYHKALEAFEKVIDFSYSGPQNRARQ
jgi:stress-induced-phosphoprotein 1